MTGTMSLINKQVRRFRLKQNFLISSGEGDVTFQIASLSTALGDNVSAGAGVNLTNRLPALKSRSAACAQMQLCI